MWKLDEKLEQKTNEKLGQSPNKQSIIYTKIYIFMIPKDIIQTNKAFACLHFMGKQERKILNEQT